MKKILFVCVENSCRSQMAEAFATFYGKDEFEIFSAGSKPLGRIHPTAVQVLREKGLSAERQSSKGLLDLPDQSWDIVVTMGCGDECPNLSAQRRLDWEIENPKGKDLDFFRHVRDEIEKRVKALLNDLRSNNQEPSI